MEKLFCRFTIIKYIVRSLLVLFLLLSIGIRSEAQDIIPIIEIEPGTTVEVGEEVYFSATRTTSSGTINLEKARYEWDFGDGYSYKFGTGVPGTSEYYYLMCQGVAATHYFMAPGDYKVTLSVKAWEAYDDDGSPLSVKATSSDSVPIGKGVKQFKIETGLSLIPGMPGTIMVTGNTSRYMRGTIAAYDSVTGMLSVEVTSYGGSETFSSWSMSWDTMPFHQAISTTVHVTGVEPVAGFEIQRAPLNNRLAQYLYVQIPEAYQKNSTKLSVSLIGDKSGEDSLLSKTNLSSEEIVFLDHKPLGIDNYVIQAKLLDSEGRQIPGGIWRDKFSKRYSGIPKVGIDENNSFRVSGELFFPMAPFILDESKMPTYIEKAGINALDMVGYYSTHTPTTWQKYLDAANLQQLKVMGPGRGEYFIDFAPSAANRWKYNHNPDRMAKYVQATKDHPAMFAWNWQDEPNLGGWAEKTYPPTLAAWAYVAHREDPHHPSFNSFVGSDWSKYYGTKPNFFDYLKSGMFMGGKKWSQDILSWDTYPITQRLSPILNFSDMGPYAAYLDAVDRAQANNRYLLPFMSVLQPCKGLTSSIVSEEQVYLETWLNVIHGAKGIIWFNYFDMANTGRWAAMKKFADQIKVLAPAVLQADPSRTIMDTANSGLNRVDTMIREHNGDIFIFAARVTEPEPIEGAKYRGVEPEEITVNFSVSGLSGSTSAMVVDEGRYVSISEGQFADTFNKNTVHIYKISNDKTQTDKNPPKNVRFLN